MEAEIPNGFGNVVLQPESIKSYFKNPDSTWTYLVHWKDIWLHESLCGSFTNLVEEFWKNETLPIVNTGSLDNHQNTIGNGITSSCDINQNISNEKLYRIVDENTFLMSNSDSLEVNKGERGETNMSRLTNSTDEKLPCTNTQVPVEETEINNVKPNENKNCETIEVIQSKDALKEIIDAIPFDQALSELDDELKDRLLRSLDEVPVSNNNNDNMNSEMITQTSAYINDEKFPTLDVSNPKLIEPTPVCKNERSGQKASRSTRNNPIECEICHKVLSSRNSLREHRITVHLKNGKFPCDVCCKRFTHQRALRLHRVMHTKDRNFVCPICYSSHKRERELELHMRDMHTHTQVYRCDICSRCFAMKGSLKQHCFTEHETTITNCKICKQKLTTPFSIYTHCLKHAEPREFKCNQCSREFKSKAQLKKHIAVHDPEKRPYKQCPKCYKLIFSRSHYYEHVNSHDNDTNEIVKFKCTQCDASFQHSSSLKRHRVRHRPGGDLEYPKQNPYIDMDEHLLPDLCCKRCRKLYTSKSGYYEHKKRCRDGISTEELCLYCNKLYSSRKTLNRHIRHKHSMEEIFDDKDGGLGVFESCHDDEPDGLAVHIVAVLQEKDNNELGFHSENK